MFNSSTQRRSNLKRIALTIALCLLTACTALERNPATAQLVTQYAVAKYLEQRGTSQRYDAAQRIIRIAGQLMVATGEVLQWVVSVAQKVPREAA
jgi:hypothetical protein